MVGWVILIISVGFFIWLGISGSKLQEQQKKEKGQIRYSYNYKNQELSVSKRGPGFKHILGYKPHEVKQYEYVRPTYTYSSATVGGVTTGGISKSGDYYKDRTEKKNYELVYFEQNILVDAQPVKYIILTEELAEMAKKSIIGSYLYGNAITVVGKPPQVSDTYIKYAQIGMMDLAVSQRERELADIYPTQYKCENIIKWLSESD